jgi:hypothetical protein
MARATFLAALLATLNVASSAPAQERERLRVRVVPQFTTPAPGNMRVIAWVEPDARNRRLIVELDSIRLFRSTERPLDGEHAARRHAVVFTHLPAGNYEIRIRLTGIDSDVEAVRTFQVI